MHSDASDENSASPFDEALQLAGGFGRFQILLVAVFLSTATLHYVSNHLSQIFILLPPNYYGCRVNVSSPALFDLTDPQTTSTSSSTVLLACGLKDVETIPPVDLFGEGTVNKCPQGWEYIMEDLFPTIATQNNWVCGDSWKQYMTHTLFCLGSMCGYIVSGFLSDRFGRLPTVAVLSTLAAFANVLPLFISSDLGIMFVRFLAGIGADTVCSIVFLLVLEYTVPSHRTLIGTVWATGWTLLGGLYPWYARLVFSYRYLLLTTSIISVALIVMCLLLPESASWLASAGRIDDAKKNLMKVARFNGRKDVSEADFEALLNAIESPSSSDNGSISALSDASTSSGSSFWAETVALITTPNLRRTTMLLFSSWFLICLCYHADTLGLGHLGLSIYPTYSMSAAFELPINIFTIFCLDSIGRRWPNVCFMAFAGTLAFTFAIVGDSASETVTMTLAILLIISIAGSYNITYQLAAELFPTVVRGRGVLLSKMCGDMGNVIATLVAYLVEINKYALMSVVGTLAFVAALLLFFIPETTHEPLPQTLEDGEQFGKNQSLLYCPIFASDNTAHKLGRRSDAMRTSMSNISYTSGRPANTVQPMSTPDVKSKLSHGKKKKISGGCFKRDATSASTKGVRTRTAPASASSVEDVTVTVAVSAPSTPTTIITSVTASTSHSSIVTAAAAAASKPATVAAWTDAAQSKDENDNDTDSCEDNHINGGSNTGNKDNSYNYDLYINSSSSSHNNNNNNHHNNSNNSNCSNNISNKHNNNNNDNKSVNRKANNSNRNNNNNSINNDSILVNSLVAMQASEVETKPAAEFTVAVKL